MATLRAAQEAARYKNVTEKAGESGRATFEVPRLRGLLGAPPEGGTPNLNSQTRAKTLAKLHD